MASIEEGVAFCLFVCRERKERRRKEEGQRVQNFEGRRELYVLIPTVNTRSKVPHAVDDDFH